MDSKAIEKEAKDSIGLMKITSENYLQIFCCAVLYLDFILTFFYQKNLLTLEYVWGQTSTIFIGWFFIFASVFGLLLVYGITSLQRVCCEFGIWFDFIKPPNRIDSRYYARSNRGKKKEIFLLHEAKQKAIVDGNALAFAYVNKEEQREEKEYAEDRRTKRNKLFAGVFLSAGLIKSGTSLRSSIAILNDSQLLGFFWVFLISAAAYLIVTSLTSSDFGARCVPLPGFNKNAEEEDDVEDATLYHHHHSTRNIDLRIAENSSDSRGLELSKAKSQQEWEQISAKIVKEIERDRLRY